MRDFPDFEAALTGLRAGDKTALDLVIPVLYAELRRIAQASLAGERLDHTLQPTALVHEVYLRRLGQHHVDCSSRPQILGLTARIVEPRFFSALSVEDTVAALGISAATVKSEWPSARLWLGREMDRTVQ